MVIGMQENCRLLECKKTAGYWNARKLKMCCVFDGVAAVAMLAKRETN
jgi:hypothetical protein